MAITDAIKVKYGWMALRVITAEIALTTDNRALSLEDEALILFESFLRVWII